MLVGEAGACTALCASTLGPKTHRASKTCETVIGLDIRSFLLPDTKKGRVDIKPIQTDKKAAIGRDFHKWGV
jgi:hypothetical protein